MWNSKLQPPFPAWRRWVNRVRFLCICKILLRKCRPRLVIGYDTAATVFVPPVRGCYRTVYHFHELPELDPREGPGPRKAREKAAELSRQADLVVFSDDHRAGLYQQTAQLPTRPSVVMNCPARLDPVPQSPLRQQLAVNLRLSILNLRPSSGIVCYTGSVGVNQGLPEVARSMRHWPADSVFVLIGPAAEEVREDIVANARAANADSRVVFLGPRPHSEALALTAGADLGLSLIQPHNQNRLYSAGAVNKRFEYMALGLPQVANAGPGVPEIIEQNECGLCVDPYSPEAISAAVNRLLRRPELCRSMGKRARKLHLDVYNYETEFCPVLEWVKAECASATTGAGPRPRQVAAGLRRLS